MSRTPQDSEVSPELDRIDQTLLGLLRSNARMSNVALAEAAGIAQSTCVSRIRSLVDRGIIQRFTVEVGLSALGLSLQALISVSIRSGQRGALVGFSEEMRQLPEVVQVFFLGSSDDFIVHVAVADSDALRDFVVSHLSAHPAVASTRTSIVFERYSR